MKCVIFDFDDTIVYSEKMKLIEFFNISKKHGSRGIKFYYENIDKRLTRHDYFKKLSDVIALNTDITIDSKCLLSQQMIQEFGDNVSKNLKTTEEIKNIKEFLKILKDNNYLIFISSKSKKDDIINTLKHKNLFNYFDDIYGLENTKIDHFNNIITNYNLEPRNIYFFGDSYSDYEVSIHFNCNFIGILTERDDLKNVACQKINNYEKIFDNFIKNKTI